jgi:multiple sugar transport system ATP-binding protein
LDAAMRVQMRTEIVGIHRRVGCSTVYVTHDQSEAMTMSDRVAVMMDGEILQVGTPEEIYTNPIDLRVASFVGSPRINSLEAFAGDDGEVRVEGAPVSVRTSVRGRVTLAVRPEDLAIGRDGIACDVEQVEYLGDCLLVHAMTTKGRSPLIAKLPASERRSVPAGSAVLLRPDPAKALLFQEGGRRVPALTPLRMAAHG